MSRFQGLYGKKLHTELHNCVHFIEYYYNDEVKQEKVRQRYSNEWKNK